MSFILLVEQLAPDTPSTDQVLLYAKSDGLMYGKNDAGTESQLTGTLGIVAGTRMLFQQTSAPTGWTKESAAAYNDAGFRVTTGTVGTGGADAFNTLFGTGKTSANHTLTTAQIPAHIHQERANINEGMLTTENSGTTKAIVSTDTFSSGTALTTSAEGGGGAHGHTLINMDLKFVDCIIAAKD